MRRILDLLNTNTPAFTLGAALLLSVVMMSLGEGKQAKLRSVVHAALWPSQRAVSFVDDYSSLWFENMRLRRELTERMLDQDRLRNVMEENRRLRRLLAFRDRSAPDLIPAQLIARDAGLLSGRVTVDRGSADGVRERMTVVCPRGLVGMVVGVGRRHADVEVLTAKGFAVSARVLGRDVRGIVKWDGLTGRLVMKNVPVQTKVEPGEVVVSSNLGGNFADNIRIGRVVDTSIDENKLLNEVFLESPAYLWSLREVFIVRDVIPSPLDTVLVESPEAPADGAR